MSDHSLECYRTTSEHVPEHKQFTAMMHDVHAHTERERKIERAAYDAPKPPKEIFDLTNSLDQLHCRDSQVGIYKTVADHRSDARSIRRRLIWFRYPDYVGASR